MQRETTATSLPPSPSVAVPEKQRSEVVKALLENGFTISDIWKMAPALLGTSSGRTPAASFPIPVG